MVVIGGGPTATIAESSTVKVVAVAAAAATLASNAANMTSDDKSASAPAPLAAAASTQQKGWNTKNLGQRVAVDAMSAATAGGLVAPIVSMIDKAIIENASGKRALMASIRSSLKTMLLRPHTYILSKPFALIFMVYGGTYLTANTLDTFQSTVTHPDRASTVTHGPSKFLATSTANLTLTMIKDSQFTKMFGTATSARPVPPLSYALFAFRDCMTVYASFNLPPLIAPALPLNAAAESYISRASAAQFLAPAAVQLISTPCHLYGLDLYNRPGEGKVSVADRLRKVGADWGKSSLARMCRIVPAFGFGGVVNTSMRKRMMTGLE